MIAYASGDLEIKEIALGLRALSPPPSHCTFQRLVPTQGTPAVSKMTSWLAVLYSKAAGSSPDSEIMNLITGTGHQHCSCLEAVYEVFRPMT